jgi:hypothetical protein
MLRRALKGLAEVCQKRGPCRKDDDTEVPTLFGRYDAIDAVKTMEPLTPCLINARAATLAE